MMDRVMAQSVPDMTGLLLWVSLVTGPQRAEGRLEGVQPAADDFGLLRAGAAQRRRAERVINTVRVTSARTPSRIHSQRRLPLPVPAAGEAAVLDDAVVAGGVGVAVEVTVDVMVVVGVTVGVTVGVGVGVAVGVTGDVGGGGAAAARLGGRGVPAAT